MQTGEKVLKAKIFRGAVRDSIEIIEQVNGKYTRTYAGVKEAARARKTSDNAIKNCLASGLPLNYPGTDSITFDVPTDSPYYYEFVPDEDGNPKATLFIELK